MLNRLSILDGTAEIPFLLDWPEEEKSRLSQERLEKVGTWDYAGCGRCFDLGEGLIIVKGFVIDLGDVPWDGPVEFKVQRLNL